MDKLPLDYSQLDSRTADSDRPTQAQPERRASFDTSSLKLSFANSSSSSNSTHPHNHLSTPSTSAAHHPFRTPSSAIHPSSTASPLLALKRNNSQPNLHQPISHPTPSPTPHKNSLLPMDQQDIPSLPFTSFPRRCSPKLVSHHKRTLSVTSSIGSAAAHHHQLLILNRHPFDQDDQEDQVEIEGGMSGLLKTAEDHENPILDCPLDDRRASESCGSSVVGEPMSLDPDPPTSRPSHSHLGAKRVRRKHVNRANLLPRPKAHLRVAAQLSTEEVSPDLLTEAEVHRRFKSIPFVVPQPSTSTPTNTLPSTTPSNSPLIPRTPSSPFYHHLNRPTPNRFPEQADDDDDGMGLEGKSSGSDEEEPADDHQSHCSGLRRSVMSQDEESEDQKMVEIQKWKMFRGSGSSGSCGPAEINRTGKRRCQEPERYEYGMFKRRAVSPSSTSLSSCIGSPIQNPIPIPQACPLAPNSATPSHLVNHQSATVNSSSSSSSASSLGFRTNLGAHHLIVQKQSLPSD
ncbi:uncharacterized protein PGTG_17707 [Puccinia graminis f. sp. tritici CRL 75-36-700-3]|uniref:Uncharacterized protein n=1 Tax=Puccinia graminis f. sp. tritici (strain CRL 75-36-700-3 / race SCCL) TaxID=418459 RepID=E3L4I2_PUCGT|nr:uncharacterized protein PGTG_17707 [Puccinia graminis f. sp. tritici CRL 75-36-700-3]EFP91457.1 hypothetical protein PGTG_17707 [Puccinia graminis f. sp. tritici CRL 75-36-700-3]